MKFLIGAACMAIIAVSGTYLFGAAQSWSADRQARQIAAEKLCLRKKIEAANYQGGMDWTGADNIRYATADAYCR